LQVGTSVFSFGWDPGAMPFRGRVVVDRSGQDGVADRPHRFRRTVGFCSADRAALLTFGKIYPGGYC
jgi:hypothetical protein